METTFGIAGMITAAAITPGPNNFAVLQVAARHGIAATGLAIAGVVAGGLAMLALCYLGPGAWLAANPRAGIWVAALGSGYLALLALRLLYPRHAGDGGDKAQAEPPLPVGPGGLFAFQFVNPKSWILVMTATSVAQASQGTTGFALLVTLFLLIPTVCLLLWSLLGAAAAARLSTRAARRRFDRSMGILLAASVLLMWR